MSACSPTLRFMHRNFVHFPQAAHRLCVSVMFLFTRWFLQSSLVTSSTCFFVLGRTPLHITIFGDASKAITICLVNSNMEIVLSTYLYNNHKFTTAPFRQNQNNGQYHFFEWMRIQYSPLNLSKRSIPPIFCRRAS